MSQKRDSDGKRPRPKRPNTKLHWALLAVARYFEEHGEAARVRDIHPRIDNLFDSPNTLSSTMFNLYDMGVLDHVVVISPNQGGDSAVRTNAYYPTNITIDTLRDLGEPEKLPNGNPVPDDYDTHTPTERVALDDEVPLPSNLDRPGVMEWSGKGDRPTADDTPSPNTRDTETKPAIRLKPQPRTMDDDLTPAIEHNPEFTCDKCGETFENNAGLGSHRKYCDGEPKPEPEPSSAHESGTCPDCGGEYLRLKTHLTMTDCERNPDATLEVGHDLAYMEDNSVDLLTRLSWADVSNRFSDIAQQADDAGITEAASLYHEFAAKAMKRHLAEQRSDSTHADIIGDGPALKLLGHDTEALEMTDEGIVADGVTIS